MNQIHAVQLDIAWENREANFSRVESLLRGGAVQPGDLVVLPEMFAAGFSMNVAGIAEAPGGATEQFLCRLARQYAACVIGGIPVRGEVAGKGRNTALVAGPDGGVLGRYVKRHPFTFAGETSHYESGTAYLTFAWNEFKVAPLVCYDLRFPESFRVCAGRGVTLFAVIANWPASRREHWRTLLAARAIENQAYVVGVNRTGRDPAHAYAGDSMILGPRGELLADAGAAASVIRASADIAGLRTWREQFPALCDMGDGFGIGARGAAPESGEAAPGGRPGEAE